MSVKATHELKRLQGDKERLAAELANTRKEVDTLNKKVSSISSSIKGIDTKIQNLTEKEIIVSEHALLRYIERVYSIDLEELKSEILTEESKSMIKFAGGNGKFTSNGVKLVVRNGTIVTVT